MGELAKFQIDQDEAAKQTVVEDQIDVEVIAFDGDALLAGDEAEAPPELQFADRPAFAGRLDLVEGSGVRVLDGYQEAIVGP